MFADEPGMGSSVVFADAKHFDVVVFEAPPAVSKVACFFRATWSVVFWVEIKDDSLSLERGEPDRFTVLIGKCEIWSQISDLKGHEDK